MRLSAAASLRLVLDGARLWLSAIARKGSWSLAPTCPRRALLLVGLLRWSGVLRDGGEGTTHPSVGLRETPTATFPMRVRQGAAAGGGRRHRSLTAAVEKHKGQRKPAVFFGHRKAGGRLRARGTPSGPAGPPPSVREAGETSYSKATILEGGSIVATKIRQTG